MKTALVGGTLVTLNPKEVVRADLVFEGARIVQVGGEIAGNVTKVDATGCLILPALVVAHTHLYSALACGMPPPGVPPKSFLQILEKVWWRLDKALDLDLVHTSALVGALEAAKRGVALVVDHHASPNAIDGSLDRVADALDEVGLRGVLCYETSDRDGKERRDQGLRENERFLSRVKDGISQKKKVDHRGLVGAHAPFTLDDDTLEALADLADRSHAGIHVHVAEDTTDEADANKRGTELRLRLDKMGVSRAGSIVAHAVHLPLGAIEALQRRGAWIVTNARSNMNNAVGLSAARGPRVAMGTDGIGADMFAEAQAHFFRHAEAKDGLAGDAVGRLDGAQKLGSLLFEGHETSPRLAPGERADLMVLAYDPPTPLTPSSLEGHVLFAWSSALVRDTIVGGRFVVRDRVVQTVNERRVADRARSEAARLWARMGA